MTVVAAIDIGTNSVHMIIVRVRPDFSFEIVDREKEMVRLGAGGLDGKKLTPPEVSAMILGKLKADAEAFLGEKITQHCVDSKSKTFHGDQWVSAELQVRDTLARIPGIESIKDSGGDAGALTHVRENYGSTLQIANGWDILTYFGLSYGLKASVWGAANIFPELAVELFNSIAVRGDLEAGRKIWSKIVPVLSVLDAESYTARVKAASALVGLETGPSRPPLLAPEASAIAELKSALTTAGLSVK